MDGNRPGYVVVNQISRTSQPLVYDFVPSETLYGSCCTIFRFVPRESAYKLDLAHLG